MSEKNAKRSVRNDIILIAAIVFIAVIGIIYLFCFRPSGNYVEVTVDGKLYGTYSLSENRTENIISEYNNGHNTLVIKDGKAEVTRASCPDGICAAHSPIYRDGESIVCLPNRVVITVISKEPSDAPDMIS